MKRITNLDHLEQPSGKPYTVQTRPADPAKGEDDGKETYSVAQWIDLMLGNLPRERLWVSDAKKAFRVLRACRKAEDVREQAVEGMKPVIVLDDDHHAWLLDILFDEKTGKRLFPGDPNRGIPAFEGGFALNAFGFVAVALQEALEDKPPLSLVSDDEENDDAKAGS